MEPEGAFSMTNIDWTARVKEALDRTDIMALSTIDPDGSWTSPVQYRYSEKLNLYFVSLKSSKHVANMLHDPRVSVAIYKPEPFPGPNGGNLGLQIRGRAHSARIEEAVSYLGYKPTAPWQVFKITPEELWCFDSRIARMRKRVDVAKLDFS
jgi:uncharacterized protein YhbP (UPF0306 family)